MICEDCWREATRRNNSFWISVSETYNHVLTEANKIIESGNRVPWHKDASDITFKELIESFEDHTRNMKGSPPPHSSP